MLQHKGDKNVIRVLAFRAGASALENVSGVVTNCARARIELLKSFPRICRLLRRKQSPFACEDIVELVLQGVQLRAVAERHGTFVSGAIEVNRRLLELVEQKDHCAKEQDEKLHRHLHNCVEEQAETAGPKRPTGEIALHL